MTVKEALATAKKYGLVGEVKHLINKGYSPEDALYEYDIL